MERFLTRAVLLALLCVSIAQADQTRLPSFKEAKRLLWERVYAQGGETIYCEVSFRSKKDIGGENSVEHVVPRDNLEQLCPGATRSCERYYYAAADLHNLWPALNAANHHRSNYPFAEIPGENARILRDRCADFERDKLGSTFVVEPRDRDKGEIARSILYMAKEYGLRQIPESRELLLRWHRMDAPSAFERHRNDVIEQLQGTRNPYIDGLELNR